MVHELDICTYAANRCDGDVLVDIREKLLYSYGTIPGAINIPLDDIRQLYQLPKERDIYVFCQAGEISQEFAELLRDAGYNACHLSGGYREYFRKEIVEAGDTPPQPEKEI